MWRSSIPRNWSSISSRPARRIKGSSYGKRDTLEFLRETQQYIDTIRKPIRGEEEILGVDKSPSPRPILRSKSPSVSPVPMKDGPPLDTQLASPFTMTSTPVSRAQSPSGSPKLLLFTRTAKKHTPKAGSLGSERQLIRRFPFKHSIQLVPHSLQKRTFRTTNKSKRRVESPELVEFLTRFDRKQCATEAAPVSHALPGWKLTSHSPQSAYRPNRPGRHSAASSPFPAFEAVLTSHM